jgi:hypothetical protein
MTIKISFDLARNSKMRSDTALARNIQKAINLYISDSDDRSLTFGETSAMNVNKVLEKLQSQIKYKGKLYGPYLVPVSKPINYKDYYPQHSSGWYIEVDSKNSNVIVKENDQNKAIIVYK